MADTTVGFQFDTPLALAAAIHRDDTILLEGLRRADEAAYETLILRYEQPVFSLVSRLVDDAGDAADVVQEVFLKVFRNVNSFRGESSLKTWIYRIALHEASNRRRWWFRHKAQETPIDPVEAGEHEFSGADRLVDRGESPFEKFAHTEVRAVVEEALTHVPEPYRTALILRDLEDMSYEEVAEVLQISLGTVKSRITRGRDALRKKLTGYVREAGSELGLLVPANSQQPEASRGSSGGREVEVTP